MKRACVCIRSEGFAVDKLTGLSTPNNGVDPLTCGFCWYQEKEVPFNLQELCQWQCAFLDNDVVLHVCKMQRVKSAQEGILQAAPNPILWDRAAAMATRKVGSCFGVWWAAASRPSSNLSYCRLQMLGAKLQQYFHLQQQTLVELTHVSIRHEALEFAEKVLALRGAFGCKEPLVRICYCHKINFPSTSYFSHMNGINANN
ncbi:uncharacterized protein [Triticum aestivum]|uniref:uncharacterized protein isoform X3 n=1 Tax=Triticum aestivum TaxID=4565 RepID=UPI001D027950|nr:uncharacterized protein LOC123063593 isoform X3 [Triticum aestivum]XP_044343370.1 uncharacterized protein LOC123063593 isoform X3 [Triticum aestivum]XP_044343371.1 uncharacterized protein LOC123063593 isoform X3 [Triticum aestivum]